jgi:hypothetical protein
MIVFAVAGVRRIRDFVTILEVSSGSIAPETGDGAGASDRRRP